MDIRFLKRITHEVDVLLQNAVDFELLYAQELEKVHPDFHDSARNLLHYLGVRAHDVRKLQENLSTLGLSSLGRMEAHTLATLDAVLRVLHQLSGTSPPDAVEREPPVDFGDGPTRLLEHANSLLGPTPNRRAGRIMVTMPSEAARDAALVVSLLEAGMNVMRVNCAHDGPTEWLAMFENLRRAEQALGVRCRILADLAGPKLRTGAILGGESVLKIRPQRDSRGRVTKWARVQLVPAESRAAPVVPTEATLPLPSDLLAQCQSGDMLVLDDTRGRRRRLVVQNPGTGVWHAETDRTCYIEAGQRLRLMRDGRTLIEGRVGPLAEQPASLLLRPGDQLRVTTQDHMGHPARRDVDGRLLEVASIPCTLDAIIPRVQKGERIWFDDGRIGGAVCDVDARGLLVDIVQARPGGSRLRADKGINLPDTTFDMPALTDKDYRDLEVVAPHVDMLGLSFVRRPEDIEALADHLSEMSAAHLGIVLKIENRRAFERLPRILLSAMRSPPVGIMVARGDLAVEMGFERLAEVQEEILWMCEAAHVPVIWATQVLEGLAKTGAVSRAEVTDAAMSSRAECVMLNKGPYIVEAARFLGGVLERMQSHQSKKSATLRRLELSSMQ